MEAFWQSRSLVNPPKWVSRDGIDLASVSNPVPAGFDALPVLSGGYLAINTARCMWSCVK
jgi:hypothetical protein